MSYTLAYTGAEIDALLGKIDAIFVAEYGSTIYSEVTAAIAAGNKVIVANAGKVFVYAGTDDNGGYVFTQSGPNAAKPNATYVTLSTGNVWSTATVDLATLQQFYSSLMEDSASGSIASFPDGAEGVPVKELTADIEPIQDLHGQPFPYPDGGYKNKLAPTEYAATTSNGITFTPHEDGTISVSGTATGLAVFDIAMTQALANGSYILNGCPSGGGGSTFGLYVNSLTDTSLSNTIIDHGYGSGVFTISDSGIYRPRIIVRSGYAISGTLTFKPMIRLSTEADATFAPYSNICPITGYTGAEITVTGINVWDEEWEVGTLNASGQNTPDNTKIRSTNYMAVKAGQTYYVKSPEYLIFCEYDQDKTFIRTNAGIKNTIYTVPEGVFYVRWRTGNNYGATYNHDISINYPSTDTSYHAYLGTVYSVSWSDEAGTVYKGNLNATTGVLTITHGSKTFSGSDSWGTQGSSIFYTRTDGMAHLSNYSAMMCSLLKSFLNNTATAFTTADYGITGYWDNGGNYPTQNWIYVKATGITSGADLNTFFAANPATVVYPLATPITVQLTPTEVQTLLGDNNIWSDTGDISVKYRCNTALYIEKKLG